MRTIWILMISVWCATSVQGTGIEFFQGSWAEALAEAKAQGKPIFVDAYASWCGPCKVMARNVFANQQVGDYYNEYFVNFKIDMEKGEGPSFGRKYPVSAYPTLYFIDYSGEVIRKVVGGLPADRFIQLGESVINGLDRSGIYAEAYEKGDRSPELILDYVTALKKAGKSSLRVANDYFRSREALDETDLRILFEALTEADSRLFRLFIDNRDRLEQLYSGPEVRSKILEACEITLDKSIEYNFAELRDEAKDKVARHYPAMENAFHNRADLEYAHAAGDGDAFMKALKQYRKTGLESDTPETLMSVAMLCTEHYADQKKALAYACDIAEAAAVQSSRYDFFLGYAEILLSAGNKNAALKAADEAMALAESQGSNAVLEVQRFMAQLRR